MKPHVLAVVDDLLFSSKIKGALESIGYTVKIIGTPSAAAAHAREFKPDLVIVDLGLVQGDPFELIKVVKEELTLPVLAYTRHTDLVGQEKARALGCDKVVVRSSFFDKIDIIVGLLIKKQ